MKTTNNIIPFIATHPGEMLLDELEAMEISQIDFAKQIGYQRSQLNEIIKGKRNVNADLALLLQECLGIDAEYWMEAQKNYDLDKARIENKNQRRIEALAQWKVVEAQIAAKFLKKQKVISGDPVEDIEIIKEVYNVSNLNELSSLNALPVFARFRKSTKLKYDPINIIGWVKLVHYRAKQLPVSAFNPHDRDVLLSKLKTIFTENTNVLKRVPDLLSNYGIKLIFQEKAEKTPVDGVSFWSNENPAIGMTLRHSRLDNFAFTLFHELGHVFEHLTKSKDSEFVDLVSTQEKEDYKNSKEEKEADSFALDHLIDRNKWEEFCMSVFKPLDKDIREFSEKIGMHPCIVRGRLCHHIGSYRGKTGIDYKIY
jgi:HTH-type transcriptional regulator/antitoxin HigA